MNRMEDYVHLNLIVIDGKKIWAAINVIRYTPEEKILTCLWSKHHGRRPLFQKGTDIRCFTCIQWGNYKMSNGFTRVGHMLYCGDD